MCRGSVRREKQRSDTAEIIHTRYDRYTWGLRLVFLEKPPPSQTFYGGGAPTKTQRRDAHFDPDSTAHVCWLRSYALQAAATCSCTRRVVGDCLFEQQTTGNNHVQWKFQASLRSVGRYRLKQRLCVGVSFFFTVYGPQIMYWRGERDSSKLQPVNGHAEKDSSSIRRWFLTKHLLYAQSGKGSLVG